MYSNRGKRKVLVKKKHHRANSKVQAQRSPEPVFAQRQTPLGVTGNWMANEGRRNEFRRLPTAASSIRDRVKKIQQMKNGFLSTPIWDPEEDR